MASCNVIHAIETSEPGGAESILVQIADGMRELYVPSGLIMQDGWTSKALDMKGIPVYYNQLNRSFDIGWVTRAIRIMREHDIKLIHSHEFTANSYLTLAARIAGIPIICTVHGKNYYPHKFYRREAYRQVARYANKFVAVSEDLKLFLVESLGIQSELIDVVHNGINTNDFDASRHDRNEIRQAMEITHDQFVIIVVAALFEMKGHKDLVESIRRTPHLQHALKVIFVGDGPYREELKRQVIEAGIEHIICFAGFRDDIPQLLSASDLFVLPSYSEGLPVSVLEAMSCGLPVVATDVGGMREIIKDGNNGILVPSQNPSLLSKAIELCRENKSLSEAIGIAGRNYVIEKFSMKCMLDRYHDMYSELLGMADT